MASTRKASISAELRADRSRFKADLDGAKKDAQRFKLETTKTLGPVSDIALAAKMKELRGETLKATDNVRELAREFTNLRIKQLGIQPIRMQASGLKRRDSAPATPAERQAADDAMWADPTAAFGAAAGKTQAKLDGLTRSTRTANQAMRGMQGGATNAGMGMLMLSQTIDDAQYGVRGIINNIAPLVMSLGGGTGLAGALTVALVAGQGVVQMFIDTATQTYNAITGVNELNATMQKAERVQRQLEKSTAAYNRETEKMAEVQTEVNRRGAEVVERQRKAAEAEHALRMQKLEAEQELAQLRTREEQQNELLKKQAREKLEIEKKYREEQMQNLRNSGRITATGSADTSQLNALRSERDAMEALPGLSTEDKRKLELLKVQIANAEAAAAADEKEYADQKAARDAALNDLALQGTRDAIADEKEKQRQGAQLREAWKVAQSLGKGAAAGVRDFFTTSKQEAERQKKEAERAASEQKQRDFAKRELEVQTLRAAGKGKAADAAEKALQQDQAVARFQSMGFSPEEAKNMAQQQAANASPRRRGRISSTGGGMTTAQFRAQFGDGGMASQAGGLDHDPQNGIGIDFSQRRSAANNARGALAQARRAAADTGNTPEVQKLSTIIQKLDELIDASSKTAGDRVKPGRAA